MFQVSLKDLPRQLFIPRRHSRGSTTALAEQSAIKKVTAIIPAFKPPTILLALVNSLLNNALVNRVIVIDDATPEQDQSFQVLLELRRSVDKRLRVIRNSHNLMCAGSVNEGLRFESTFPEQSDYILVVNDDTLFERDTISELVKKIEMQSHLGAVCAQVRVANARKNLLTRLQRLEYRMFNVVRKADEGFLYGPLIMPGMTVMFRREVIFQTGGYDPSCIIEDYEMTVRVKKIHWHVAMAEKALAWTVVPETFKGLWKQRIRWYYGGLTVVRRHWRHMPAIFSDVLSHVLNIALVGLVVASVVWTQTQASVGHSYFTFRGTLLALAIFGITIEWAYLFWIDKGKDWIDVLIVVLIIPELYYRTLNTVIVFGCYAFYLYKSIAKRIERFSGLGTKIVNVGDKMFAKFGFTAKWGTK